MSDTFGDVLANQYEAALCTLAICIDRCPEAAWDAPVANLAYCQAVFHTLFYADFYLGVDESSFRAQSFHRDHPEFFRDYEELEDRAQVVLYDRPTTRLYLEHCRENARAALASATPESLAAPCGFARRDFSRAELHVYNIRHIQHHSAQLSLRLRLDSALDIPWVGSGWPASIPAAASPG